MYISLILDNLHFHFFHILSKTSTDLQIFPLLFPFKIVHYYTTPQTAHSATERPFSCKPPSPVCTHSSTYSFTLQQSHVRPAACHAFTFNYQKPFLKPSTCINKVYTQMTTYACLPYISMPVLALPISAGLYICACFVNPQGEKMATSFASML